MKQLASKQASLLLAWLLCQEAKGDRRGITLGCVQHMYLDGRGRPHLVISLLLGERAA